MASSIENISEANRLLKNYNGSNSYLISLKNSVYVYKDKTLNDFHTEYIIKNANFEPIYLNKIVKIADWFGEKKQLEWNTEFLPQKLLIGYFLGETNDFYHCYVKYRKSQEAQVPIFIPKKALLTQLFEDDWKNIEVDFEKYNKKSGLTLKPHQEKSIKFLLSKKKAILSLEMGMGKSVCGIVAALEGRYEKVLVICPASLKTNWKNELGRFIDEDEITIVEGSKWKDNKFTIINYDILKNFYTVPKETRKIKEKDYTDDGKVQWKTVEKVVKTNKTSVVDAAMDNSQLFQSNFDLIIIDEAHRLSNKTSGMYEIVDDLVKRSKPSGIFELTGTMVKNNPINLYNILKLIGAEITNDWVYYVKRYCDGKQIFRNKKERDYFTNQFLHQRNKNSWYDLTYSEKQELNDLLDRNCKKIWLTNGASNLEELAERIKHLYYREDASESLKNIKKEVKVMNYTLNSEERSLYKNAWREFVESHEESDMDKLVRNHKLIEGSVFRQLLAEFMIKRTITLAEGEIALGKRIIIFCCFDKELYTLQEYFGERSVVYNGKMTAKKKDETFNKFKNDDSIKVFIGNLQAAGVGLNLNECSVCIFNNPSFVPADNTQGEFRCLRLGQDKDVTIYYQKFEDTYMDKMFDILDVKNNIIENVILTENNKEN